MPAARQLNYASGAAAYFASGAAAQLLRRQRGDNLDLHDPPSS